MNTNTNYKDYSTDLLIKILNDESEGLNLWEHYFNDSISIPLKDCVKYVHKENLDKNLNTKGKILFGRIKNFIRDNRSKINANAKEENIIIDGNIIPYAKKQDALLFMLINNVPMKYAFYINTVRYVCGYPFFSHKDFIHNNTE